MGLDVVMIGLDEIKENVKTDAQVAAMVKWLQENVPASSAARIGEPAPRLAEGERVGSYSDLHVLRGLAIRFEREGGDALAGATEDDFAAEAEAYYAEPPATRSRFRHLVDHSDCEGVYVPLPLDDPVTVTGQVSLAGAPPEEVNVSIGSSGALLAELEELAPLVGLAGDRGDLGDAALDNALSAHPWPTAAYVWAVMHWFARESVRESTLIQFC